MTLSFLIPYFNGLRTVYISREQSIINQYMIKCRALLIHSTVSNEHNQSMTRLKIAAPSLPSPFIFWSSIQPLLSLTLGLQPSHCTYFLSFHMWFSWSPVLFICFHQIVFLKCNIAFLNSISFVICFYPCFTNILSLNKPIPCFLLFITSPPMSPFCFVSLYSFSCFGFDCLSSHFFHSSLSYAIPPAGLFSILFVSWKQCVGFLCVNTQKQDNLIFLCLLLLPLF